MTHASFAQGRELIPPNTEKALPQLALGLLAYADGGQGPPLAKVLERLDPPQPEGLLPTTEIMRRMDLWRAAYARTQTS